MRKRIIALVLGSVLLLAAAPAWACQAPPEIRQRECRASAVGGGPADSVINVTATNADALFDARLIVIRERRVPTGQFVFSSPSKRLTTLLSVAVPDPGATYSFVIPHRFRNGGLIWAFVVDGDTRTTGCENVGVTVDNLF